MKRIDWPKLLQASLCDEFVEEHFNEIVENGFLSTLIHNQSVSDKLILANMNVFVKNPTFEDILSKEYLESDTLYRIIRERLVHVGLHEILKEVIDPLPDRTKFLLSKYLTLKG